MKRQSKRGGPASPPQPDGGADVQLAVQAFAQRLPAALQPLARLIYNYRWSWVSGAAAMFRDIDPLVWERSECNPRYVLEAAAPGRLEELASDASYVERVRDLAALVDDDLARPTHEAVPAQRPIAYFCSEFGLHCSLPIYGGGLGVLAGDLLKAASDMALPMVGVGLLYRQGYFRQRMDVWGWQHEYWTNIDFGRLPIVLVRDTHGQPVSVQLTLRGRPVRIQVWRVDVGRVPLYLLDTDRDDNHPIDRWITARLYVGDRQTRLAQYAVLGIGGVRALAALGIEPSLVHLNEGHAAFGGFERLRSHLDAGQSFEEAAEQVRRETVFTTHTPVAAGNEGYGEEEIEQVLGAVIDEVEVARSALYDLGRLQPGNRDEPANITPLALRLSRASNAVSMRHGEVARAMWQPLWPDRAVEGVPIGHVTNGVHLQTWMSAPMRALLDRHLGPGWCSSRSDSQLWQAVDSIPDAELWEVRCEQRRALVDFARARSIRDRLSRGEAPDYVDAAARWFDPNTLTIGFARRMAKYKRFYLLSRHTERGLRILADESKPIQLLVAGKAHPQDQEAKEAVHNIFRLKETPVVGSRVAFLEDYDLHMAPRIVAGVDVWLNLPRPPLEASGTSGMKVALNGGLNLSVLDGWWAEAFDGQNGWGITSPSANAEIQDEHDASALLDLLEQEVIPMFYERDETGLPRLWLQRVKRALRTLVPRFTAERMLSDYVTSMYAPEAP
jgi:starch phosphorylase